MARTPRAQWSTLFLALSLGGYLLLHLWSISWFPFVHSDEAWLASLSRRMLLEGRVDATEEFFHLTPRYPHALKTLFHLIQAPFLLYSWDIVAARLPSLLAGLGTVVLVAAGMRRMTGSLAVAGAVAAGLALDVQFFYASHFARQEVFVLLAMAGALWWLTRGPRETAGSSGISVAPGAKPEAPSGTGKGVVPAGAIIGLTIFLHPNAFVAALAILPWVVARGGRSGWRRALGRYFALLASFAAAAVGASFLMDPGFISHYLEFGGSVGVTAGLPERVARLGEFFLKMAGRHAGTYYLPPVAPQLWALPAVTAVSLAAAAIGSSRARSEGWPGPVAPAALSALSTLLAIFLIGKYSPPILVFFFPWLYIQAGLLLDGLRRRLPRLAPLLLILIPIASGVQLAGELPRWYPGSYDQYLSRIREAVPRGDVVLANLNTAFAFEPGALRVWRDLGALPARPPARETPTRELEADEGEPETALLESPLGRFLRNEKVRWVVLPVEELELIYRNRPVWNEVYGNPHRFYPELLEILRRYGTMTDRFEAKWYAMRLLPYMDRTPHHVEIYRLELP
ncbi:MAG: ArnT family glycosyltransferase [Alkalispirochaetaceae bacterium]